MASVLTSLESIVRFPKFCSYDIHKTKSEGQSPTRSFASSRSRCKLFVLVLRVYLYSENTKEWNRSNRAKYIMKWTQIADSQAFVSWSYNEELQQNKQDQVCLDGLICRQTKSVFLMVETRWTRLVNNKMKMILKALGPSHLHLTKNKDDMAKDVTRF